jgi:hypothetical protein
VYYVHRLIEKYGRKGNLMKWNKQLNGPIHEAAAQWHEHGWLAR